MTDQTRGPKPDGSAYKMHLEEIARRNAEVSKAGKSRRAAREHDEMVAGRSAEQRQNTELRASGHRGKAQLD